MPGTLAQTLDLLGRELAHHLGGAAHDHGAIGKLFALGHQRACANQAVVADLGTVQHHRTDADQAFVADGATMQHHFVAHGHMLADGQGLAEVAVQHAGILDVGAFADGDGLVVATDDGAKPDAGVGPQADIAHDFGTVGHVGTGINAGNVGFKLVNAHA